MMPKQIIPKISIHMVQYTNIVRGDMNHAFLSACRVEIRAYIESKVSYDWNISYTNFIHVILNYHLELFSEPLSVQINVT